VITLHSDSLNATPASEDGQLFSGRSPMKKKGEEERVLHSDSLNVTPASEDEQPFCERSPKKKKRYFFKFGIFIKFLI